MGLASSTPLYCGLLYSQGGDNPNGEAAGLSAQCQLDVAGELLPDTRLSAGRAGNQIRTYWLLEYAP
jgi:hypothetical protein